VSANIGVPTMLPTAACYTLVDEELLPQLRAAAREILDEERGGADGAGG